MCAWTPVLLLMVLTASSLCEGAGWWKRCVDYVQRLGKNVAISSETKAELTPQARLDHAADLFHRLDVAYNAREVDPMPGIAKVFQDETLFPRAGTLDVCGAYTNFYEWAIPVLYRPDLTLIVSEPQIELSGSYKDEKNRAFFRNIWDALNRDRKFLVEESTIRDFDAFYETISQRVSFIQNIRGKTYRKAGGIHPADVSGPLPKADAFMSINSFPFDLRDVYPLRVRSGAFLWIVSDIPPTERTRDAILALPYPRNVWEIPVSTFFPMDKKVSRVGSGRPYIGIYRPASEPTQDFLPVQF